MAENSGGAHCFKYGFTTNYVTGLELVLPDGELVTLGGKELDRPGYDLLGAFVGSEGTLGVATKITLRVVPVPRGVAHAGRVLRLTPRTPGEAVSDDRLGGHRAGRDRDDGPPLDPGRRGRHARRATRPTPARRWWWSSTARRPSARHRFEQVKEICERDAATGIRVAQDEAERELIWKARKAAFAAMGRIAPNYYVQDGVIPRTRLAEVLAQIEELAREYGLQVANVFHAGDGNLHPLVLLRRRASRARRSVRRSWPGRSSRSAWTRAARSPASTAWAWTRSATCRRMFDEPDLATFQRLRCAFDPDGLANPGKVMPTPRLCGEVPGPYREHPLEQAGVAERF